MYLLIIYDYINKIFIHFILYHLINYNKCNMKDKNWRINKNDVGINVFITRWKKGGKNS